MGTGRPRASPSSTFAGVVFLINFCVVDGDVQALGCESAARVAHTTLVKKLPCALLQLL